MNRRLSRLARPVTLLVAALALVLVSTGTAAAAPGQQTQPAAQVSGQSQPITIASPGDGTPWGAIQWFQARLGYTGYEGWCEMAVENAYGTTGQWPSAIAHWNGAVSVGKAHWYDYNPPAGAFVYWNISQWGHVGIADGNGGFYSTSVGGAIGYSSSLNYFANYLGWSNPQVPIG